MSDEDWRVEVELADDASAKQLHTAAGAMELYEHARRELRDRAALSHDGNRVFAYATTREAAEAAEQALKDLAAREGLLATFTLTHWHPVAEQWEDPDKPLPSDGAALAEEREEGAEEETEREEEEGHETKVPEFEVRLTLPTHADAVALAKQFAREGLPTQRHWHYLLIGAWTEDDANALADRVRTQAPAGTEVRVETTMAYLLKQDPDAGGIPGSPFVLF
ncbi:MAG: hypothetical protein ABSG64_04215 [Solirubrobacteraceae bacterium]|jgi:hypothetical protein